MIMRFLMATVLAWTSLGMVMAADADPALEAAKAAYQKSVESAEKRFADDKAKATQALVKAYQVAVKRAMSKGDLPTATALNAEIQELEGGRGSPAQGNWVDLDKIASYQVQMIGPMLHAEAPDFAKIPDLIKKNSLNSLGNIRSQPIIKGVNRESPGWNGISANTVSIVIIKFRCTTPATLSAQVVHYGGKGNTLQAYLNGELVPKAGDMQLKSGMNSLVYAYKSYTDDALKLEFSGKGIQTEGDAAEPQK